MSKESSNGVLAIVIIAIISIIIFYAIMVNRNAIYVPLPETDREQKIQSEQKEPGENTTYDGPTN